jgi:hypothetical protein
MTDTIEVDGATPEPVCSHGKTAGNCVKCKDAKRKREERHKKTQQKNAATQATEQLWWESNRALLTPEVLAEMVAQDEYVRDLMSSMAEVENAKEQDEELIFIVVGMVQEKGTVHLGSIKKNAEIPPNWNMLRYWADSDLLHKLKAEDEQTAVYVTTGLLSTLIDHIVYEFLMKKAGWKHDKVADLLGYRSNFNRPGTLCY